MAHTLFSLQEAAQLINCSYSTLYKWVKEEQIRCGTQVGGKWVFDEQDCKQLSEFLAERWKNGCRGRTPLDQRTDSKVILVEQQLDSLRSMLIDMRNELADLKSRLGE